MNVLPAFLNWLTSRSPALILGCAAVGLTGGVVGGMIQYSRQKPLFESHAILYPAGATAEKPATAWMESEAAVMCSRENLEEVARRTNMETERRMSASECADLLEKSVTITVSTMNDERLMSDRKEGGDHSGETGFSALRIGMEGDNAAECASVVRAIIAQRESFWIAAERLRMEKDPVFAPYRAKAAEAKQLMERAQNLRLEFIAALPSTGVHNSAISDSTLVSIPVSGPIKELRDKWMQAIDAYGRASSELSSPQMYIRPYVEVLQEPKVSLTPIGPVWGDYGWPWIVGGLGAGLIAGLVFRQLKVWQEVNPPAPNLPSATAAEF